MSLGYNSQISSEVSVSQINFSLEYKNTLIPTHNIKITRIIYSFKLLSQFFFISNYKHTV